MSRPAKSYRGARRNRILRELHTVWNKQHYSDRHGEKRPPAPKKGKKQ